MYSIANYYTIEALVVGKFAQSEKKVQTMKLHFMMMKDVANECRPLGENFYIVIPAVISDLQVSLVFKILKRTHITFK